MECVKAGATAEEGEDGRMVAFELEAAEALAGMARCTAVTEAEVISQDQPVAADAPTTSTTSPQKAERIVERIPTQLCSTSHQSNPVMMKFRRKLTEAEKEERKLRHVMANRESARQTIRRRQAMHLELTRRAADVLEENEKLKKKKELMVEDFNSLKGRNEFLKAQLAEVKKVAAGDTEEEPNSSEAERNCSATATAPIFLHNQPPPSMVPCFWPSIVPSSDVFPFQCASHPHPMQFPMPPPGDTPCLYQGQEHSTGTPLFIVPVPWLLPLLAHSSTSGTNTHYCGKCSCSDARLSEDRNQFLSNQNMRAEPYNPLQTTSADRDCNQFLSNQNMRAEPFNPLQTTSADRDCRAQDNSVRQTPATIVVPGLFSPVRRLENHEPPRTCQVGEIARDGLFGGKPEDVVVTTEARRRRKELMRLKNINCK